MAKDKSTQAPLAPVRDSLAGIRAVALTLSSPIEPEVDITAALLLIARAAKCADELLERLEEGRDRRRHPGRARDP